MSDESDSTSNAQSKDNTRGTGLQNPGLLPAIATIIILGTFVLVVVQFIETGVIKNTTARLFLAAGIILLGGKETIRALSERFA